MKIFVLSVAAGDFQGLSVWREFGRFHIRDDAEKYWRRLLNDEEWFAGRSHKIEELDVPTLVRPSFAYSGTMSEDDFFAFVDWLKNRDVNKAPWQSPEGVSFSLIDTFAVQVVNGVLHVGIRGR